MLSVNHLPLKNYKNLVLKEEVSGSLSLSFTSFSIANNAHRYLNEEAVVTIAGYEFKIKQMTETTFSKSIQAVSTFFDLGGHYIDDMFAGTRKLSDLLDFIFKGTGWNYELDAPDVMLLVPNFGNDNALKLLNVLLQVGKLEYQILPNQRVRIAAQIGPDKGAQYRYGYNIKTLSRVVDTTNLKTRIRGYGADGLNVIYTSPNASKFGIIEADPIHDDRFHIAENLVDYIKNQLQDEPLISIELDTVELINKDLGERVWLIYEPLGIEMQSRILSKNSVIRNGQLVTESVVIGNALPMSTSDLFAEQKLEYDTQNKINRSKFDQTNERITLEVERVNESIGRIELQADRIELSVNSLKEDVGSSINLLQDEISLKVNRDGVIGAINMSPERIDISASKINFNGHVFGSNATFTGTISGSSIHGGRYYGADGSSDKIDFGQGYVSLTGDGIRLARHSRSYLSIDGSGNFFLYGNYMNNTQNIVARFNNKSGNGGHLTINEITVTNFNNSSAREMKKNIEKADFNGLKKVMSTPIYQYHFKTQDDRELKHTGTIYDESPVEMVSPHGDAISPYAMTSVLWKAVQELNQKVEELSK